MARREVGSQRAYQPNVGRRDLPVDCLALPGPHFIPTGSHYRRCYAVWLIPGGAPDLRGVHISPIGFTCWWTIQASIPGRQYRTGIDRLRGYHSEAEAQQAYLAEAGRHRAPVPPPVFRW